MVLAVQQLLDLLMSHIHLSRYSRAFLFISIFPPFVSGKFFPLIFSFHSDQSIPSLQNVAHQQSAQTVFFFPLVRAEPCRVRKPQAPRKGCQCHRVCRWEGCTSKWITAAAVRPKPQGIQLICKLLRHFRWLLWASLPKRTVRSKRMMTRNQRRTSPVAQVSCSQTQLHLPALRIRRSSQRLIPLESSRRKRRRSRRLTKRCRNAARSFEFCISSHRKLFQFRVAESLLALLTRFALLNIHLT